MKQKKVLMISVIVISIILLTAIIGVIFYFGGAKQGVIGNCLDISQSTICKSSCPSNYHQISGDCLSISSSFVCCDVGSGSSGSTTPQNTITDTTEKTKIGTLDLRNYPNAKCCMGGGVFDSLSFFGDTCPSYDTKVSPTRFTGHICLPDKSASGYACQGGGYYCSDNTWNYYYCDLSTGTGFVKCDNGCDSSTGLCKEGLKECTTGYEACCNSASDCTLGISRTSGNVFKCVDSKWIAQETCSDGCTEQNSLNAYCNFKKYYCVSNCNQWTDSSKDCYGSCYTSSTECQNNANAIINNAPKVCVLQTDSRGVQGYIWVTNDCIPKLSNYTITNIRETECKNLINNQFKVKNDTEIQCPGGYTNTTVSKTGLSYLWGLVSNTGTTSEVKVCITNNITCSWYQTKVTKQASDNGLFYYRWIFGLPKVNEIDSCVTSTWVYILEIGGIIVFILGIILIIILMIKKKGKKR
jgi:hypothetical protein